MSGEHVCPWWLGYSIDNPLRGLLHPPDKLLAGLVGPGASAIDVGCGMGHFSLGLARQVGDGGSVLSVDLQEKMLRRVGRRAARAGLSGRIRLHRARPDSLGLPPTQADFALAFWMVHEAPDPSRLLAEIRDALRAGGRLLLVEPRGHVRAEAFAQTVGAAERLGFRLIGNPRVRLSRAALLEKHA